MVSECQQLESRILREMMSKSTSRPRYHDLDAARSAVMFFVAATHVGALYAADTLTLAQNSDTNAFFLWLIKGLHLFVSPTFFLIGGFFCGFLMVRYGIIDLVLQRLLRVGMPMLIVAFTFNIYENHLRYLDAGGDLTFQAYLLSQNFIDTFIDGSWRLHTWFLMNMLLYVITTGILAYCLKLLPKLGPALIRLADWIGVTARSTPGFVMLLLALPLTNIAMFAVLQLIPGSYEMVAGITTPASYMLYIPAFMIGVVASFSNPLLEALRQWRWWMFPLAIIALIWQHYPSQNVDGLVLTVIDAYAHYFCVWATILGVLQFFNFAFSNRPSKVTSFASDASFTVYLFHHGLVYAGGVFLLQVAWSPYIEFLLILSSVIAMLLLFHWAVVLRSPLLRFLLNGKSDIKRPSAAPPEKAGAGS